MAQLRHDHDTFKALNTEVVVIVPNGPKMIGWYLNNTTTRYPILSDKDAQAAGRYSVEKRIALPPLATLFTPSVFLINRAGTIQYAHYAGFYTSEPDNTAALAVLRRLLLDKTAAP